MRVALAAVLLIAACKSKRTDDKVPAPAPVVAPALDAPAADALLLPEVSGQGYDKASPAADLTVTTTAFVVDGKPVAPIVNGGAVLSDLGGTNGMQVQPVVHALATRAPSERFTIAVDRRVAYRALFQALATARGLAATRWAVLATHDGETVALPLALPPAPTPAPQVPKQLRGIEVDQATVSPATSVSGDAVKGKITAAYVAQIQRCLARAVRPDAREHEQVELGFTIDDTGHTTDATVYGATGEAASCLTDAMKTWLFPVPKDHELVPTTMGAKVTIDVTLEPIPGAAAVAPAPSAPSATSLVGMIVSVASDEISVFSSSGLEGTPFAPKLRVPLGPQGTKDVERTLLEIVKRRWPSGRPAEERRIVFTAEDTRTLGAIADLLGVLRRASDGTELFPDVMLGVTY